MALTSLLDMSCTARDLAAGAQDLDHSEPEFSIHPERRALPRAELDTYYARLYGHARGEISYISNPTDVLHADYPSETFRVLKNGELRELGDYRTWCLVLAGWDRLETGEIRSC